MARDEGPPSRASLGTNTVNSRAHAALGVIADELRPRAGARSRTLAVLDLFSGPGGMSQGIKSARNRGLRFSVVVANDYNRAVEATYRANHPDTEFVPGGIEEEETKRAIMAAVSRTTGGHGVELVTGGPPCKGFSLENKMTRSMDNPMNHLVQHYAEMIRRADPAAFIMENVPGLLGIQGGAVARSLISSFRNMGYDNAGPWLLNAADYGVPQARKRAFIVGSKFGVEIERPRPTHGDPSSIESHSGLAPYTTLDDAIGDLPSIKPGSAGAEGVRYRQGGGTPFSRSLRGGRARVANHVATRNTPLVTGRMRKVPPGGNWSDIPADMMKVGGKYSKLELVHSMIYRRLRGDTPSVTITNFRKAMIIHPHQDRLLSVREAARIQTFPDGFEFHGGMSDMQQQVSDAVPVLLARRVGEAVLDHLHVHMAEAPTIPAKGRRQRGGRRWG